MTDRERAEQALKDAGFTLVDEFENAFGTPVLHYEHPVTKETFILNEENRGYATAEVRFARVPAILSLSPLTDEERKALEFFAKGDHAAEPILGHKAWRITTEHHQAVLTALLKRLGGDTHD